MFPLIEGWVANRATSVVMLDRPTVWFAFGDCRTGRPLIHSPDTFSSHSFVCLGSASVWNFARLSNQFHEFRWEFCSVLDRPHFSWFRSSVRQLFWRLCFYVVVWTWNDVICTFWQWFMLCYIYISWNIFVISIFLFEFRKCHIHQMFQFVIFDW